MVAFAPAVVSAATVTNGSFEDLGGQTIGASNWAIFNNLPGWTPNPNVEVQRDLVITAQDGGHYAELDTNQNASIAQQLTFTSMGAYELSFYYSPRVNASSTDTNDLSFALGSLTNGAISGAPNASYPHGVWTKVTSTFSVQTLGDYTLSFTASGISKGDPCGNCGALIDNVSVAPVPVPAAGFLLAGALGGLGLMRRRKKA